MRIVMLGLPGAGKGTQAKRLAAGGGVPHVATGDIFRQAMADGTPLGREVQAIVARGAYVPDSLTIEIVRERLAQADAGTGFVLDGFPRTAPQAEALDELLAAQGRALEHALLLEMDVEAVIRRLSGRRVCPQCGAIYHVETDPPGADGACRRCGATVVQRPDDQADVQRRRVEVYEKETSPLIPFYAAQGKLVAVSGSGNTDEVAGRIAGRLAEVGA